MQGERRASLRGSTDVIHLVPTGCTRERDPYMGIARTRIGFIDLPAATALFA